MKVSKILTLTTLLVLTSCLPDSFTKYREDPPAKKGGTASGGTTTSYKLAYSYQPNKRLWFDVTSTSGFNVGDTVYVCQYNFFSLCSSPYSLGSNTGHQGVAFVYYVDAAKKRLYVTTDMLLLEYRSGMYVWLSSGSTNTRLTDEPMRLYNTTEYPLSLQGVLTDSNGVNITNSPNVSYFASPGLSGNITINSTNSSITEMSTLSSMATRINAEYTITAQNSTNGSTLATHKVRFTIVDPPTLFTYSVINPIRLNIGSENLSSTANVAPLPSEEDDLYFTIDPSSDGLPSGIVLNPVSGQVSGAPTGYTAGTNSLIRVLHPVSGSTPAQTANVNIITGTDIDDIYVTQLIGRTLLLEVQDADTFFIGGKVSNSRGTKGTVTYVDQDNNDIFITMDSTASGPNAFASGDGIDSSNIFATARTTIDDIYHIVNVDGSSSSKSDLVAGGSPITTVVYNDNAPFVGVTGEILTHSISPSLNDDLTFCVDASRDSAGNNQAACGISGGGSTIDTDGTPGQSPLPKTTYQVNVTNSVGKTRSTNLNLIIIQTPNDLSVARLQYVPVIPLPSTRFYEGTYISTRKANGDEGAVGKVIDIYTNSGGEIEGLLIKTDQRIDLDEDIDNEVPFYASETKARQFQYFYVTDTTAFSPGETISNPDGDTGMILPNGVESSSDRLTVEISGNNSFSLGEGLDDNTSYTTRETIITNITDQSYVNFVATLANSSMFEIGEIIVDTTTNARGWVVFNDTANNKVYVRHLSGRFQDGDNVSDGATPTTIQSLKANYLGVDTNAALSALPGFAEGRNIVSYQQGGTHEGSGLIIDTTNDALDTQLFIQWESGRFESNRDLTADNFITSTADNLDPASIYHENSYYLYAGTPINLQTYLKGTFTSIKIEPTLPSGLELNTETGAITGTPTVVSPKTTYTLTIRNGATPVTYQFDLEVLAQFYIYQETEGVNDGNASSYIMHKTGQGFRTADCRVTSNQIVDANGDDIIDDNDKANDIVCLMDGGEKDLFDRGINFKIRASPGLCEYVDYLPYGYSNFPPIQTSRTTRYTQYSALNGDVSNCSSWSGAGLGTVIISPNATNPIAGRNWGETYCQAGNCAGGADNVADEPACLGDHRQNLINADSPNCDEGSYITETYTCTIPSDSTGDCGCVMNSTTTNCGGDEVNCAGGPMTETEGIDLADIVSVNGISIFAFSGLDAQDIAIPAPLSLDNIGLNTFISNWTYQSEYTTTNRCAIDNNYNYDADGWENYNTISGGVFGSATGRALDPTFGFGQKSYEFRCLDGAGDLKARIRVYVRDWNRDFTPNDAIDKLDNTSGKEDDNTNTCFGLSCNDRFDWDDLFQGVPTTVTFEPRFSSCSTHLNEQAAGFNITATAGQVTGTCSTACGANFYPGVLIGVDGLTYLVTGVFGNQFWVSAPFIESYTGLPITVLRNIPFPMD